MDSLFLSCAFDLQGVLLYLDVVSLVTEPVLLFESGRNYVFTTYFNVFAMVANAAELENHFVSVSLR